MKQHKRVKMSDLKQGDVFCYTPIHQKCIWHIVLENKDNWLKSIQIMENQSYIITDNLESLSYMQEGQRKKDYSVYLGMLSIKSGYVPIMEPIPEVSYVFGNYMTDTNGSRNVLPIKASSWEEAKEIFKTKIVPSINSDLILEEYIDNRFHQQYIHVCIKL